jgi:hypothetical protein
VIAFSRKQNLYCLRDLVVDKSVEPRVPGVC